MVQLREDQIQVINDIRSHFSNGIQSVLTIASTGFGKTIVAGEIVRLALEKDPSQRILFLIHREALIRSTIEGFEKCGVDLNLVTLIQGSIPSIAIPRAVKRNPSIALQHDRRIYLVMIPTLESWSKTPGKIDRHLPPEIDLAFLDESHETINLDAARTVLNRCRRLIGLTATPQLSDRYTSLGQDFQACVVAPTHAELVKRGSLRFFQYKTMSLDPKSESLDPVEVDDDSDDLEVVKQLDDPATQDRVIDLVEAECQAYEKLFGSSKTVIFCPSQAIARSLGQRWSDCIGSNRVGTILSDSCEVFGSGILSRGEVIDRVQYGAVDRLLSVRAIAVGFDLPCISIAVLLRHIGKFPLYAQALGRACRKYNGIPYSLCLDFLDNFARHGAVEEKIWNPEQVLALPPDRPLYDPATKLCPQCDTVLHASTRTCPECGYTFPQKDLEEAIARFCPDDMILKTIHTAIWIEMAPTEQERRDRLIEVVREKWIELNKGMDMFRWQIPALFEWMEGLGLNVEGLGLNVDTYSVLGSLVTQNMNPPEAFIYALGDRLPKKKPDWFWRRIAIEFGGDSLLDCLWFSSTMDMYKDPEIPSKYKEVFNVSAFRVSSQLKKLDILTTSGIDGRKRNFAEEVYLRASDVLVESMPKDRDPFFEEFLPSICQAHGV